MARIVPVNAKGTRDFLPRDLVRRNRVFGLLRDTFERYGYEPLETPAVENTQVLEGKYGEEGDRLLFRILKRGASLEAALRELLETPKLTAGDLAAASFEVVDSPSEAAPDAYETPRWTAAQAARLLSDEALRYDLTVPFARVIAAHQNEIVFPFRRYQMQPVWRADRPQRGRYREFYQCDVDCVGSRSMTVDAEMAAIHHEVFTRLGFTTFVTRINHRGLLDALMESCGVAPERRVAALTAIDKLDKIGIAGVREELAKAGIAEDAIARLAEAIGVAGEPRAVLAQLRPVLGGTEQGAVGLRELDEVFAALADMGVPPERYTFDVSLVRALSYYTGTIYETVLTDSRLGSLGGGGRYDQLIGQFLGRELPCVGISFGIERIFDALVEKHLLTDEAVTTTQALVTLFAPETVAASLALAGSLRAAGIRTEVYTEPRDLKPQLSFANKKGIPLAVIIGPDEAARDAAVLRDLRSGAQETLPQAEVAARAQALLGA
jgi:histidyl-tRNA synthetase